MDSIYLLITTVASAEEAKNLAQKTVGLDYDPETPMSRILDKKDRKSVV